MKFYLMLAMIVPGLTMASGTPQLLAQPASGAPQSATQPTHATPQVLLQPNMSLALARELATEAQARCAAYGKSVAITVVDRAGQIVVIERGDDVGPHNVDASRLKAVTAVSTRTPTGEFAQRALASPTTAALANLQGLLLVGGGLPIRAGDQVVGAIGVAGSGSPERDEECITGVKAREQNAAAKPDKTKSHGK